MSTTSDSDKIAYCNCMEHVKRRLGLVWGVTKGQVHTGDESSDGEFVCLQLRKCLELVAFAALAAHRDRYLQIRADLENEWRAKKIIDKLKQAHPDFYPKPVLPNQLAPAGGISNP